MSIDNLSYGKKTLRFSSSNNHYFCVIEEVVKLMNSGYTCYLEEELWIAPSKTKRGYRAVVDIYAVKGKQEVLVEVGTLSVSHGDRITLLKKLKPNSKIIHVHQWKNYGITEDLIWRLHMDWKRQIAWDKYMNNGKFGEDIIKRLPNL